MARAAGQNKASTERIWSSNNMTLLLRTSSVYVSFDAELSMYNSSMLAYGFRTFIHELSEVWFS